MCYLFSLVFLTFKYRYSFVSLFFLKTKGHDLIFLSDLHNYNIVGYTIAVALVFAEHFIAILAFLSVYPCCDRLLHRFLLPSTSLDSDFITITIKQEAPSFEEAAIKGAGHHVDYAAF